MAVAVEERTSAEEVYSIYDPNEWDNEIIHQAILEHQYHLSERQKWYVGIKRVIDTCIAAVMLLILIIPFLLIAILQKLSSPTEPVFFLQDRVGMHGKVFKIIKFRTMKSTAPHNTATSDLENAEMYLSNLGKVLRRFSIDELPQLFNVLCGQMALIGPRPLIVSEHPAQYLREFYGVYEVRPGITGLAQVNGRDTLNDVDKVRYDRAYTRNVCARLDAMILLKSVGYVAKQEGIVEGKQTDVPGFATKVNENVENDLKDILMGECMTGKPKHILMAANDTTFVYNLRREILQELLDNGYKVTVMAQVLSFEQELREMGCEIINIETARQGKNPFKDVLLFQKYYRALKEASPDVMLGNNIKPNVYAGVACQMLKIPYIPNVTGLGTPVENPGPLQALTTRLYKMGVAGASCIFFQNNENCAFFESHHMMPRHAVVRLLPGSGVDLDAHPAFDYPGGDTIHFQYTSRILKEKGIDLYLAAAKAIHEKHPNTVFHICGGCDDLAYEEILKKAQEAGYVVYHGQQKDMIPFLKQASCIVHPSYYPEGMSNVLLEGAASARPIIATDRAGCRETVEDGVTGFLIPIKDEEALIKALEKFMQMTPNERKAMGLAGRVKMEREFDRKIVVKAYLEEIRAIEG